MRIKNEQGIRTITMKPKANCFCPLGDDWYTNELQIQFVPDEWFPDYCDIEQYLNENIRGKSLIIEDVVANIYDYLEKTYKPKELEITSTVNDAISHSSVAVTK